MNVEVTKPELRVSDRYPWEAKHNAINRLPERIEETQKRIDCEIDRLHKLIHEKSTRN